MSGISIEYSLAYQSPGVGAVGGLTARRSCGQAPKRSRSTPPAPHFVRRWLAPMATGQQPPLCQSRLAEYCQPGLSDRAQRANWQSSGRAIRNRIGRQIIKPTFTARPRTDAQCTQPHCQRCPSPSPSRDRKQRRRDPCPARRGVGCRSTLQLVVNTLADADSVDPISVPMKLIGIQPEAVAQANTATSPTALLDLPSTGILLKNDPLGLSFAIPIRQQLANSWLSTSHLRWTNFRCAK